VGHLWYNSATIFVGSVSVSTLRDYPSSRTIRTFKTPDFYHFKAGLSNYTILRYIGFKVIISGQGLDIKATSVFIQHLT
jgi:hypothetical protein